MTNAAKNTAFIKRMASELGFGYCGIAKAEKLEDDARRLELWLNKGMHGEMKYMENHFDLRIDPRKLVPGARSVITLLINYFPATIQDQSSPRVAKYAYGQDYHTLIRQKLNTLLMGLREEVGEIAGRGFVDSAPVLERTWAQKTGLGWIGKNGNLISKESGSFYFIATLITDLELEYDDPFAKDYCGTCTRCIDACPTQAIYPGKVVDGSKCISYFTIELKELLIPSEMEGKFQNWMFGCDTCQDVCPWNRFSSATNEEGFKPIPAILNLNNAEWEEMTEEAFKQLFGNSPLSRPKFKGIKRNLKFLQS